jgi:hypothetical protein
MSVSTRRSPARFLSPASSEVSNERGTVSCAHGISGKIRAPPWFCITHEPLGARIQPFGRNRDAFSVECVADEVRAWSALEQNGAHRQR